MVLFMKYGYIYMRSPCGKIDRTKAILKDKFMAFQQVANLRFYGWTACKAKKLDVA